MLASSVFYYGRPPTTDKEPASLFDAYDLIRDLVGLRMLCLGYLAPATHS